MRFPDFMTLGRRYVERSPGTWGHELCKLHKVHTGPTLKSWSADLSAIQDPRPANQPITELNLEQTMDEKKWEQIALLHANDIYFDRRAWELMERKLPASQSDDRMMVYVLGNEAAVTPVMAHKAAPQPKKVYARVAAKAAVSKSMVENPHAATLQAIH